jgi:hypothetical protein
VEVKLLPAEAKSRSNAAFLFPSSDDGIFDSFQKRIWA